MNERDFKGIWIPKEIWLSEELSCIEKLFLAEINSLDNDDGCFASNEYFAKFFDMSTRQCRRIIQSLKKKGHITIKMTFKDKIVENRILSMVTKMSTGGDKNVHTPRTKMSDTPGQKCPIYNKDYNKVLEGDGQGGADAPAPSKKFIKPTIEELKQRSVTIGLPSAEAEKFFNYYKSNGWRVGKNPMKSWPAALNNWKRHYDEYNNPQPKMSSDEMLKKIFSGGSK